MRVSRPRALRVRLQRTHPAKLRVDLFGCFLADMAGVEDDEVRLGRVLGRRVAGTRERFGHALGVVGVHLAAERLDVQLLRESGHAPWCDTMPGFVKVPGGRA